MLGRVAVAQVIEQRRLGPRHWRSAQRGERRRLPAVDQRAREVARASLLCAERIACGVAGTAVAEAVDEVGTTVPFDRLRRDRGDRAGHEIERVPRGHQRAHAEREREPGLGRRVRDRRLRHQVGVERGQILVGRLRERGVRKRGIQMLAIARDAFAHRALERTERPGADAVHRVGREVGRPDRAERCFERAAARVRRAAGRGVADEASAGRSEHAALLDRGRGVDVRAAGRDRRNRRSPAEQRDADADRAGRECTGLRPGTAPTRPGRIRGHGRPRCRRQASDQLRGRLGPVRLRDAERRTHHLRRERRLAKAHTGRIEDRVRDRCGARHRRRLARAQRRLARPRHHQHLDDRHLAKTQDRVGAPFARDRQVRLRVDRQRLLQCARSRLQHVAVDLVLHAGRVDHQSGVVADDDAADVDLSRVAIHFDIGDPCSPRGAEARKLAVHVACVREPLALEKIAFDRLLLRPGVREPTGARGGRTHQFAGAFVVQMPKPERHRIGLRRRRKLVDVRLVRERVRQRRDAAQPRRAQDRRHVVGDDAQVGVVVGRHRGAITHLVGVRIGLDGAGQQQRERRRAVARVRGLEVVCDRAAFGIEPAVDLHQLRCALRLPQMLLLARELHAHRRADCARKQRRIGRHVIGAVAAVAAGGFHADDVDRGVGQAHQRGEVGTQHVRVLRAGPDGHRARLSVTMPVGECARRTDRGVQLIRPDVVALQGLRRAGDRGFDIALFAQHAAVRRVVAQRIRQRVWRARERCAARPIAPRDLQCAHRRVGLLLALGDDADEIADHDHRANPLDVSDRGCVDRFQRVADEIARVDARIRRPHDAAVQHAGHALVVHEHRVATRLRGDVDARWRCADDAVGVG